MKEKELSNEQVAHNEKIFKQMFLKDAEKALKRLEVSNEEASKRKGSELFHIQGFAVIAYNKNKAKKKLRSIIGNLLKNPDIEMEELKKTMAGIAQELGIEQPVKLKL